MCLGLLEACEHANVNPMSQLWSPGSGVGLWICFLQTQFRTCFPGYVAAKNHSSCTREAEANKSLWVQGQPGLHSEF